MKERGREKALRRKTRKDTEAASWGSVDRGPGESFEAKPCRALIAGTAPQHSGKEFPVAPLQAEHHSPRVESAQGAVKLPLPPKAGFPVDPTELLTQLPRSLAGSQGPGITVPPLP